MRTWPEELAKKYPLPKGVIPERPWWHLNTRGPAGNGSRLASPPEGGVPYWYESWVRSDGLYDVVEPNKAAILREQCDSKNPLPHPGFRTGQVWAFRTLDGLIVTQITHDSRLANPNLEDRWGEEVRGILLASPIRILLKTPEDTFEVTTGEFSEEDKPNLWVAFLALESYLIADPCCPWLAPWASSESP